MAFGFKTVLAAACIIGGLGVASGASAMPAQGLQTALAGADDIAQNIENVRLICPPYRPCYRVPGYRYNRPYYRPYGVYGRPFGYGYGGGYYRRRHFY